MLGHYSQRKLACPIQRVREAYSGRSLRLILLGDLRPLSLLGGVLREPPDPLTGGDSDLRRGEPELAALQPIKKCRASTATSLQLNCKTKPAGHRVYGLPALDLLKQDS